jgi:hypothetical protein
VIKTCELILSHADCLERSYVRKRSEASNVLQGFSETAEAMLRMKARAEGKGNEGEVTRAAT